MAKKEEFPRKLFNKGQRRIDFGRVVDGEQVTLSLHPQTAASVSDEEAALLLKLCKNDLIDMNNVTVDSLVNMAGQTKIADATRAQDEEIAKRLSDARALKAKAAFDAALKEGFSDKEAREIAGLPTAVAGEQANGEG